MSPPPSVFTFVVGNLNFFAWKIVMNCRFLYSKWPHRLHKLIKKTSALKCIMGPRYIWKTVKIWRFDLGGWFWDVFCKFLSPLTSSRAEVFFNQFVLSLLVILSTKNPIIYDNLFYSPPLATVSFRQKLCSLPTKNVKMDGAVEFVTQKSIIWSLPFFLKSIFQTIDMPLFTMRHRMQ